MFGWAFERSVLVYLSFISQKTYSNLLIGQKSTWKKDRESAFKVRK